MFVLTSILLGLTFAVSKTMAATGLGLFGGYTIYLLATTSYLPDPLQSDVGNVAVDAVVRGSGQVVWRF